MITLKKGAKGNYFNQEMIENNYIDGFDIQLTIDIEIQKIIQEEIKKMVVKSKAKLEEWNQAKATIYLYENEERKLENGLQIIRKLC